jgi:putative SOS response-associated peptidase YedK
MPLVLPDRESRQLWLEERNSALIEGMLHTPADGVLKMYQVSDKVNSVRNNGVELHEGER